jgi:CubicO group peptidase (beta-lactamase class C family)
MEHPRMIRDDDLAQLANETGFDPEAIVAISVANGDGTVAHHARGTIADGRPMTVDTVVYGASLTKQVTATAIARLVQRGSIDPDRSIDHWFPNLPSWARTIRVRHLLHHTSGLPDETILAERMGEMELTTRTNTTMLRAVATFDNLVTPPGEAHQYCNIGYVMLAEIVAQASGEPIARHLARTIFEPLGMSNSLVWSGPDPHPDGANPLSPATGHPHSIGDGGMWTTATDLVHWIRAMNADTFGVRDLLLTPGTLADGSVLEYGWGVGIARENDTIIGSHGGGWHGSVSHMAWFPDHRTGYIAFTVTGGEPLTELGATLRQRLSTA